MSADKSHVRQIKEFLGYVGGDCHLYYKNPCSDGIFSKAKDTIFAPG